MRFNEIKIDERLKLKEMYPHLTEEQLDEILPALALRAVGTGLMGATRVGARMMGKGITAAAKLGKDTVVGAGNLAKKLAGAGKNIVVDKAVGAADKILQQKLLKPGQELAGGIIDKVTGSEVTINDPKNKQGPKMVYDKKSPEIKSALDNLSQQAQDQQAKTG